MLQLQEDYEKFLNKNIRILAVCPENEDKVISFKEKNNISFDLLPDNTHEIAKRYSQQFRILKLGRMPAQIILNKDLNKVFEHYSDNMKDIIKNEEILAEL